MSLVKNAQKNALIKSFYKNKVPFRVQNKKLMKNLWENYFHILFLKL